MSPTETTSHRESRLVLCMHRVIATKVDRSYTKEHLNKDSEACHVPGMVPNLDSLITDPGQYSSFDEDLLLIFP